MNARLWFAWLVVVHLALLSCNGDDEGGGLHLPGDYDVDWEAPGFNRAPDCDKPSFDRESGRGGDGEANVIFHFDGDAGSEETGEKGDFVVLAPSSFVTGPNVIEDRSYDRHPRNYVVVPRTFAIQSSEITNAQFEGLMGYTYNAETAPCPGHDHSEPNVATITSVSHAAAYLNKLSEREGYPSCYDCVQNMGSTSQSDMYRCQPASDWECVTDCPGYRFPTSNEWELAARAGALGSQPCLTSPDRGFCGLGEWDIAPYANIDENCFWPLQVKRKLPNHFGIFDMLGNAPEVAHADAQDVPTGKPTEHMGVKTDDNCHLPGTNATLKVLSKGGSRSYPLAHEATYYFEERIFSQKLPKYGFRPVRTLPEGTPGLEVKPVYVNEAYVEPAAPPREACDQAKVLEADTPVLTFINPYPGPFYTAPLAVMRGRLWFGSWAGVQTWPSLLPGLEINPWGELYSGKPVEAWDAAWVGSNHGGFWAAHTDSEAPWPTLTQLTGGMARSTLYDPDGDRILGWHRCDLFIRNSSGRSRMSHFQVSIPVNRVEKELHLCTLDGHLTAGFGGMIYHQGHVLLNDYIVRMTNAGVANISMGLFQLTDNTWKFLTDFAHDRFRAYGANEQIDLPFSRPLVYEGVVVIPSIPGSLWSWDGKEIRVFLEDNRIGTVDEESLLAVAGETLFVAASGKVYRVEDDGIEEENAFSKPRRIMGLVGDDSGRLFVGGDQRINQSDSSNAISRSMLAVRTESGWLPIDRGVYDPAIPPPITTISIGANGKGLAGGSFDPSFPSFGSVLRFDGARWYPWTVKEYPVVAVHTGDGEQAWFATRAEIFRISDSEGVVREALPHSKGRYILSLAGDRDKIYATGEWGLLWVRDNGNWKDISSNSADFIFSGLFDNEEAVLVTDSSFFEGGRFLRRLDIKTQNLTDWAVPNFLSPHNVPINPVTIFDSQRYHLQRSHITRDAQGRFWLGRKDGIWMATQIGGEWERVAPGFPGAAYHIVALAPCGDGICRVGIRGWRGYQKESWLDILRPDGSGGWRLIRRPLLHIPRDYAVLDAAPAPNGQLVMVGTSGLILEYGPRPTLPCDLPDFVTEPETEPYPQALDIASLRGGCVSSGQEASPACTSGRCRIPAARYCIGGTDEAMMLGFAQADEFPAQAVALHEFEIDELPVTRQAYVDFLNTTDPALHGAYVAFDPDSAHERGVYRINYGAEGFSLSADADAVLDFATQDGALAYCDAQDMHLCSAIEWEAACRGFSDAIQNGYQEDGTRRSPFGVRGMGHGYYELVADFYAHDSLWASVPPGGDAGLALLKGGWWDVERTCWSRTEAYFAAHPLNYTFRCCR